MQDQLEAVAWLQPHGDAVIVGRPEARRVPLDSLTNSGNRVQDQLSQHHHRSCVTVVEVVEVLAHRDIAGHAFERSYVWSHGCSDDVTEEASTAADSIWASELRGQPDLRG